MRVSTKGRYALRMLLDLAERKDEGFVPLKEIAQRQGISKQYLEQIVSLLQASNMLRANRGKQGGYMLAKKPSEYTAREILRVTEGSLAPVACLEDDVIRCDQAPSCKTLPLWVGLGKAIMDYLDGVTLQDILDWHETQNADNYVI
ncbi:MAG: RrF2 family transcriptional regulator [Treponema sp.]|nr:RrF2 family transcriptional regulator [Treponema sp.]